MAAIISGPDPYRELEIYLQKMNEEIGEVFDKWNGGRALSSASREESSPEENGVADLSESSPPDLFKSLPARKKRQWRRSRGESGKFATVAASSVKTSSTSACGSDAGMGWTELHSFIEAQLRQLAEEEDSGVPNSPLSPTAVNGVLSGGAFDSLTNGDHVGEEEDGPDENSVNYRRPSRRRSKEENSRAEKFVIDGEVWPKASNGAVRVNGNSHGSERAVQFDLQNGVRERECGKVWGGRRVNGNGCIPDRLIVGGKGAGKVVVGGRALCLNSAFQDLQESMQTYHVRGAAKAVVNGKKEHFGGERGLPDLVGSSPVSSRRRGKSEGGGVRNGEDASSLAPLSVGSSPVVPPRSLSRTLSEGSATDAATQTSPSATAGFSRSSSFAWLSDSHLSEEERTEEDRNETRGTAPREEGASSSSSSSLSSTAPTSSSSPMASTSSSSPAALSSDSGESLTASLETMTSMTLSEELSGHMYRCQSSSTAPHPSHVGTSSGPSATTASSQSLPRPPRVPRAIVPANPNDLGIKSSSAPILIKQSVNSNANHDKSRAASERLVVRTNNTSRGSIYTEIEAAEACRWLRAAGFPQYAQMYEEMQFPMDLKCVSRDHPFLDADSLEALFRRLFTLNLCAQIGCSAPSGVPGGAMVAQLTGTEGALPIVECIDSREDVAARRESRCGLSSRVPSRDLGDEDDEVEVRRATHALHTPPPAPHPRRRVLSSKGGGIGVEEEEDEEEEEVQCALSDNWAFEPGPRRWSRVESGETRGSEDSLDEPWGGESGAEATEETEENRSREGIESNETSVASVVSRESLEEPTATVEPTTKAAPVSASNTFHRSGSERIKEGARALLRRMESFKGGVGGGGGSGGWRRRKRRGVGSEDGGVDFISGPQVQDPESMQQKVRELNCVDVSPTNGEALVGGSLASPEASSGKEARKLLRRLRQRTLSSEDGRTGALSDSECHTFSSATPRWQQLLMKSTYSIQPSERRLEESEPHTKSTSLIRQRYKSRRAASLNLGSNTKSYREGLSLGRDEKEMMKGSNKSEDKASHVKGEEVITRARPGRRWLEEGTGERGSVYDNVPVVILNKSYREETSAPLESHLEESLDTSIPKKWLSNTSVVRWHSFQICSCDSRKRRALGRSRSDGSKTSSEVRHHSRSSTRLKGLTKEAVLSSSPSKHSRESMDQSSGDPSALDPDAFRSSSEINEGPRTLALHGKEVAMCVALGFSDSSLPKSDTQLPKDNKQSQILGEVPEISGLHEDSKDISESQKDLSKSLSKEKEGLHSRSSSLQRSPKGSQDDEASKSLSKEKEGLHSRSPSLQRSPKGSEDDEVHVASPVVSLEKETEFRSSHVPGLETGSYDLQTRLGREEDGVAISALSCGQLLVLRKLALLRLTALMESHCSSSSVSGASHHRSGSPSSAAASSVGGSWSWELPRILLLRRSKATDFKDKKVFGVPLWVCLQRSGDGIPIPPPITAALSWLRMNALNQVGLFRRSGVKSRIARLRAASEEAGWEMYSGGLGKQEEITWADVGDDSEIRTVGGTKFSYLNEQQAYDVADMVKLYFRELPEALLSSKLSDTFISVFQHVPEEQRKQAIQCLLLLLPDENREVLQTLLDFLAQVASHSNENQMTVSNLAVCLAPSLFHHHHQGRSTSQSQRHHSPSPSQSPSPSPQLSQPTTTSSSCSTSSTSSSSSSSSSSSTNVTQAPLQTQSQSGGTPKKRGLKKGSGSSVVVVGPASTEALSTTPGMPDPRELSQSRAAHDCLHFLLRDQNSLFRVPEEMLLCCRFSSLEESIPVSLSELGSEMGSDWRAYLKACIASLLKEVRDRNRVGAGWFSINMGAGGDGSGWRGLEGVEAWWRKVGDGHPLRLWRIEADVEAPPPEVARRLISERHLWDPALLKCRRLKISQKGADDEDEGGRIDAELFQYVRASISPLPPRDYCVLRGWRTDLERGGCAVVEASVEHPAAPPLEGSVRGVVLASRYLITPCGSGRSRIIHLSRVDAKGRTPDWYKRSYAHQVAYHLARVRESFRHVATGPESKV